MITREQHIWKAKHQRGLTDEQIQYFLDRDSRFDLLPYYSLGCRRLGCEKALEAVIDLYGPDPKEEPHG